MKILDVADSWWLWKWFLTIDVTKRLFNPNLDIGVVCDQRASQPRSWRKVTKGLLNLGTWRKVIKGLLNLETGVGTSIKGLLNLNLDERQPKGFLTLELEERRSKGFLTLKPKLEYRSKGFSTLVWNCWDIDQRASLL